MPAGKGRTCQLRASHVFAAAGGRPAGERVREQRHAGAGGGGGVRRVLRAGGPPLRRPARSAHRLVLNRCAARATLPFQHPVSARGHPLSAPPCGRRLLPPFPTPPPCRRRVPHHQRALLRAAAPPVCPRGEGRRGRRLCARVSVRRRCALLHTRASLSSCLRECLRVPAHLERERERGRETVHGAVGYGRASLIITCKNPYYS